MDLSKSYGFVQDAKLRLTDGSWLLSPQVASIFPGLETHKGFAGNFKPNFPFNFAHILPQRLARHKDCVSSLLLSHPILGQLWSAVLSFSLPDRLNLFVMANSMSEEWCTYQLAFWARIHACAEQFREVTDRVSFLDILVGESLFLFMNHHLISCVIIHHQSNVISNIWLLQFFHSCIRPREFLILEQRASGSEGFKIIHVIERTHMFACAGCKLISQHWFHSCCADEQCSSWSSKSSPEKIKRILAIKKLSRLVMASLLTFYRRKAQRNHASSRRGLTQHLQGNGIVLLDLLGVKRFWAVAAELRKRIRAMLTPKLWDRT